MPPSLSANFTYGDINLTAAIDPIRHGYGKFSLPSNIEMTAAANTPQFLKTTLADVTLQGAKSSYVTSILGKVGITAATDFTVDAVSSTATLSGAHSVTANGGDVTLTATQLASKLELTAPSVNLLPGVGGFTMTSAGTANEVGMKFTSTLGNYTNDVLAGKSTTTVSGDIAQTTSAGSVTTTVTDATKSFNVAAAAINLGNVGSLTTAKGNFTVNGDLKIIGSTTAIDTVNMTVKDNLVQLNAVPDAAGRFPGLIMSRHADDHAGVAGDESSAFIFDEAADRFRLGYTADNASSASLTISRPADLAVDKLYCSMSSQPPSQPIVSRFRASPPFPLRLMVIRPTLSHLRAGSATMAPMSSSWLALMAAPTAPGASRSLSPPRRPPLATALRKLVNSRMR
jgi:hypothetical protein